MYNKKSKLNDGQFRRKTGVKRATFSTMVKVVTEAERTQKNDWKSDFQQGLEKFLGKTLVDWLQKNIDERVKWADEDIKYISYKINLIRTIECKNYKHPFNQDKKYALLGRPISESDAMNTSHDGSIDQLKVLQKIIFDGVEVSDEEKQRRISLKDNFYHCPICAGKIPNEARNCDRCRVVWPDNLNVKYYAGSRNSKEHDAKIDKSLSIGQN